MYTYVYIYTYSYIRETPKGGVGPQLHKIGGVKSRQFGSSVANGNGTKYEL